MHFLIFLGIHCLKLALLPQHRHVWTSSSIPVGWVIVEYTDYLSEEGGKTPPNNECPRYDMKQSNAEELWVMQSTPSLSPLPGPLWPGVVASEWKGPIYGSNWIIWRLNCVQTNDMINWNVENRTVKAFILSNEFGAFRKDFLQHLRTDWHVLTEPFSTSVFEGLVCKQMTDI